MAKKETPFRCENCKNFYASQANLDKHKNSGKCKAIAENKDKKSKTNYVCQNCGKEFGNRVSNYNTHIATCKPSPKQEELKKIVDNNPQTIIDNNLRIFNSCLNILRDTSLIGSDALSVISDILIYNKIKEIYINHLKNNSDSCPFEIDILTNLSYNAYDYFIDFMEKDVSKQLKELSKINGNNITLSFDDALKLLNDNADFEFKNKLDEMTKARKELIEISELYEKQKSEYSIKLEELKKKDEFEETEEISKLKFELKKLYENYINNIRGIKEINELYIDHDTQIIRNPMIIYLYDCIFNFNLFNNFKNYLEVSEKLKIKFGEMLSKLPTILGTLVFKENSSNRNDVNCKIYGETLLKRLNKQANLLKIINNLDEFKIVSDIDALGELIEKNISMELKGKASGQFYTPTILKYVIMDELKPILSTPENNIKYMDPCAGSGGMFINLIHYFKEHEEYKSKLTPDLVRHIFENSIYANEIDDKMHRLLLSNIIMNANVIPTNIKRIDTIREYPRSDKDEKVYKSFDYVITNPPFGKAKGVKDELYDKVGNLNSDYTKDGALPYIFDLKDKDCKFLMKILMLLKVGGKCGIVLPQGGIFDSSSKNSIGLRKLLLKSCEIQKIINVEKGIFANTGIETNIVIFEKKINYDEIANKKAEVNKVDVLMSSGKPIKNELKYFVDDETVDIINNEIKFYDLVITDINTNKYELKEIRTITKVELKTNEYKLKNKSYDTATQQQTGNKEDKPLSITLNPNDPECKVLKLSEVCKINRGSRITKKDCDKSYEFEVYGGGKCMGKYIIYNVPENTILIAYTGNCGYISKYDKKIWVIDSSYYLSDVKNINTNYLYFYLKYVMQHNLFWLGMGPCQKNLPIEKLQEIPVKIPSREIQEYIVNELDKMEGIKDISIFYKNKKKWYKNRIEEFLTKSGPVIIDEFKKDTKSEEYEYKRLDEISQISRGKTPKNNKTIGNIPIIGGGKGSMLKTIGESNTDPNIIIISRSGSAGYISIYDYPTYVSEDGYKLINIKYNNNYLYYYLKFVIENRLMKLKTGIGPQHLQQDKLAEVPILIPKTEELTQTLITKFKETEDGIKFYEEQIQRLEREEELILKQIKEFILTNHTLESIKEEPIHFDEEDESEKPEENIFEDETKEPEEDLPNNETNDI